MDIIMNLRITEECFGINRVTGERNSRQTDEKIVDAVSGTDVDMPVGRRKFHIDTVSENSVTVTVVYENNPAANKTYEIAKGESVLYRPMSRDGGYKYTLSAED